jgi:ribonuclease E
MSCIVRTAGLQRTKTEIKRDFDYLARLWDDIRENTMKANAPELIHSDSDLVKRAIRDIYNREIEEVVVEGEAGYRAAKDFMKLLMPSHGKRVKQYADPVPLYQRYGAEDQLSAMYDPVVQLRSGGYLVINPTEALVSIDINSGRSTKELGIEQTAVSTNLEAAREIARQLRLRDMAGLVVIDFIDMEYGSNVRKVEKAMKDALKDDRARIQVGRISGFGLMEMSRQRLRTGVLEATTRGCPHCDGTGLVRTASSAGLSALRMIEDEAAKGKGSIITLYSSHEAAIYVLNAKRHDLAEIEARYGVLVEVIPEGENEGAKMRVASRGPRPEFIPRFEPIAEPIEDDLDDEEDEIEDEEEVEAAREPREQREPREPREPRDSAEGGDGAKRKRRRRRRGRNRDREDGTSETGEAGENEGRDTEDAGAEEGGDDETAGDETAETGDHGPGENGDGRRKRRRRNRRRRNRDGSPAGDSETSAETSEAGPVDDVAEPVGATADVAAPVAANLSDEAPADAAPKPKRSRRKKAPTDGDVAVEAEAPVETPEPVADAGPVAEAEPVAEKPKRSRRKKADAEAVAEEPAAAALEPVAEAAEETPAKPKRARRKKADAVADAESVEAPAEPIAPEPAVETAGPESAGPDGAGDDSVDENGAPRRGWWQRTFGA